MSTQIGLKDPEKVNVDELSYIKRVVCNVNTDWFTGPIEGVCKWAQLYQKGIVMLTQIGLQDPEKVYAEELSYIKKKQEEEQKVQEIAANPEIMKFKKDLSPWFYVEWVKGYLCCDISCLGIALFSCTSLMVTVSVVFRLWIEWYWVSI